MSDGRATRRQAPTSPRRQVTQTDVARVAGVSTTVVSYVLNNGPRPVAPETRRRVLAAMEQLDYRPDAGARALRKRHQEVLGLVVPDMANPFYAELAREIEMAARARGYALLVCNALRNAQTERTHVDVLLEHRAAGVMMTGTRLAPEAWQELAQQGVPLVFVNSGRRPGFTTLMSGGAPYVQQLVTHLVQVHAHRRIAYVGRAGSGSTRFAGYQAALDAAGVTPRQEWVIRDGNDPEAGRLGLATLLERLPRSERPTAVVGYNDLVAIGVLRAAAERGLRVPDDLAVAGYDGIPLGAFTTPSLTTVAQDVRMLAAAALDALPIPRPAGAASDGAAAAARGARPEQDWTGGRHLVIPARLVLRESCGCPGPPLERDAARASPLAAAPVAVAAVGGHSD